MNAPHSDMRELPHDQIVRVLGNYRKRTNPEKDAQLAESIKQHGLIQPICVRPSSDGASPALSRGGHPASGALHIPPGF